jgi:outer membrane protein OmpA-like peptidoglycan-associated protein
VKPLRPIPLGAVALFVALFVALSVAACSPMLDLSGLGTRATAPRCGQPESVLLVIGAHRNAPAPALRSPLLLCQVGAAIRAGKPVWIVVASGQPRLITPRLASVTGGTLAQQDSPRAQQDVQRLQSALAAARPESPGVNDLEALSIAADEARSSGEPRAELVLIDSGLDDRGALDFTVPGMVAATPTEVIQQLKASGNVPDLHGFTVVLAGVGYTAAPQTPLSAKWRSNVTQIWTAVVTSAGAKVVVIPQPSEGPSVPTAEPVRLVPVPPVQQVRPRSHTTITFTAESPVTFLPNSTAFADPAAAVRALTPIAKWLAADPARRAALEGTTADVGPMSGQIELSRLRAARVRDELIALGAFPAHITTTGVGSDFPQFLPDRNAAGDLLAGPAALNRSVRITLE